MGLADRLESAADALTTVDRSLSAHAGSPGAFGADDEGAPGRLSRRLHDRWLDVLAARSAEAAEASAQLLRLATDTRLIAAAYAETDEEAGRRISRSL